MIKRKLYLIRAMYNGVKVGTGYVPGNSIQEAKAEAFRQLKAKEKEDEAKTYAVMTIAPEALTFEGGLLAVWNEARQTYWRPDGNN